MKLLLPALILMSCPHPSLGNDVALSQLEAMRADAAAPAAPAAFPAAFVLDTRLFSHGDPLDVDGDRDGLDDRAEDSLAQAFRPWLVFDSRENALRHGEPVTLYQARPIGCVGPFNACGTHTVRVRLMYTNYWAMDGGYGPESFFCAGRDKHIGDDQNVTVVVRSDDDGLSFRAESVDIGAWIWPTKSGQVHWRQGRHFELYLSAGKHHHFFDARGNGRSSPYSQWDCSDSVDGRGESFLSRLSGNVGEPEAHPAPFVGDLAFAGFPGENAWGTRPFCGGLKCDRSRNPTSPPASFWSREPFSRR